MPLKGDDNLPPVPEPSPVHNIQLECDNTTASLEQLKVIAKDDDPAVLGELVSSRAGSNLGDARVCVDLGYAWPSEARPARERQGAVATQLANFADVVKKHAAECSSDFRVQVCGPGTTAIAGKLRVLAPVIEVESQDLFDSSLQGSDENVDYLYLSPDAEEFLDTSHGWPRSDLSGRRVVLVVGGIVDRKVKRGRSAKRAAEVQQLSSADSKASEFDSAASAAEAKAPSAAPSVSASSTVRAVQLPLTADDLGAPLNIDTVLTMLFYWKIFDDRARADDTNGSSSSGSANSSSSSASGSSSGSSGEPSPAGGRKETATSELPPILAVGKSFEAARHCAMFEHRQRHPQQGKHVL